VKTKIDNRLHFLFAKDDTQEAFSWGEGGSEADG
jgi:hypothetical protein